MSTLPHTPPSPEIPVASEVTLFCRDFRCAECCERTLWHLSCIGTNLKQGEDRRNYHILNIAPACEATITANTRMWWVFAEYKVVVVLDVTQSMATVSGYHLSLKIDMLRDTLRMALQSLAAGIERAPGKPRLLLTVVRALLMSCCQARGSHQMPLESLCQGLQLTVDGVEALCGRLNKQISLLENKLALAAKRAASSRSSNSAEIHPSDVASMMKGALFTLGLLPPSSCPAIVLLTDGISELPESLLYDNSFMRLCRANTPVVVVPVGDPAHLPPYGPLGYVEDWELAGHVASITHGAVLMEPWSEAELVHTVLRRCSRLPAGHPGAVADVSPISSAAVSIKDMQFQNYTIAASMSDLIQARLNEGFRMLDLSEGCSSATLHRQWRPDIMIQYCLQHTTAQTARTATNKQRPASSSRKPLPWAGLMSHELLACYAAESTEADMDPPRMMSVLQRVLVVESSAADVAELAKLLVSCFKPTEQRTVPYRQAFMGLAMMCAEPVQQRLKTVFEILDVNHAGCAPWPLVQQFLRLVTPAGLPAAEVESVTQTLMGLCEVPEINPRAGEVESLSYEEFNKSAVKDIVQSWCEQLVASVTKRLMAAGDSGADLQLPLVRVRIFIRAQIETLDEAKRTFRDKDSDKQRYPILQQLKSFVTTIRECDHLFIEFNSIALDRHLTQQHSGKRYKFWQTVAGSVNTNTWHAWMPVMRVEVHVPWPASQMDKAQHSKVDSATLNKHLKESGHFLFLQCGEWATVSVLAAYQQLPDACLYLLACHMDVLSWLQTAKHQQHLFVKILDTQEGMPKLPGLPDVPRKSFVLMRLLHESPSLISAHFGFYNLAKSEQLEQVRGWCRFVEEKICQESVTVPDMQFTILSRNYFAMLAGHEGSTPKAGLRRSSSERGSKYPHLPLLHDHLRTPSLRVLASYCHHVCWVWPLEPAMQVVACERMLQTRLKIQLSPISTGAVSQNERALNYAELFTDGGPEGDVPSSFIVQSVVSRSWEGQVSSELWVEPQEGKYSFMENGEEQVLNTAELFDWIKKQLHSCDSHIISSLDTFNAILTRCRDSHNEDLDKTIVESAHLESPKASPAKGPGTRGTIQPVNLSVEKLVAGMPQKTEHLMALLPEGCVRHSFDDVEAGSEGEDVEGDVGKVEAMLQSHSKLHSMLKRTLSECNNIEVPMGLGEWMQCAPTEPSEAPSTSCFAFLLDSTDLIITLLPEPTSEPVIESVNPSQLQVQLEAGFVLKIFVCSIKAISPPAQDVIALAAAIGGEYRMSNGRSPRNSIKVNQLQPKHHVAVEEYCHKLRERHQRNIVFSIAHFLNLPEPLYIASDDLTRALASCRETVVGVSLSMIIDVLTPTDSDRFDQIDKEYNRVLGTGFQRISGSEMYMVHRQEASSDESSATPCFFHAQVAAVGRTSSGEESTHLAPLTHSLVEGIQKAVAAATENSSELTTLTLQLHIATVDDEATEGSDDSTLASCPSTTDPNSPSYIGPVFETVSPIVSDSGSDASTETSSGGELEEAIAMRHRGIPMEHVPLVMALERQFTALVSEELLHSLLDVRPLQDATVSMVLSHLTLHALTPHTIRSEVPLQLDLLTPEAAAERFQQQLLCNPWLPVKCIGSWHVCMIPLSSNVPNLLSPHSEYSDFVHQNDVFPVELPDWQACEEFDLPFWALLHLQPGSVQICLQSKPAQDLAPVVCSNIQVAVGAIVERLQRILQLEHLHDLKDASESRLVFEADKRSLELEAPPIASTDKNAESEQPPSNAEAALADAGGPAEEAGLACPCVHEHWFYLHNRLSPIAALNTLREKVLSPFAVMRKPTHVGNLFVFRDERGCIFHMSLSTRQPDSQQSPSPSELPDSSENVKQLSRDSSASKGGLLLRVYGVDTPTVELTHDLINYLEDSISEATLAIITSILTRNPQFKLTPTDLRFVKPSTCQEAANSQQTFKMPIPCIVADVKMFMECFQRRLLTFLHTVHTRDTNDNDGMRSSRASYCEASTEEPNSRGRSNSSQPGGLSATQSFTQSCAFDQSFTQLTMQDTTHDTDTLEVCDQLHFYYNPAYAERRRGPRTPSRMGISFIDVSLTNSSSRYALPLQMAQEICESPERLMQRAKLGTPPEVDLGDPTIRPHYESPVMQSRGPDSTMQDAVFSEAMQWAAVKWPAIQLEEDNADCREEELQVQVEVWCKGSIEVDPLFRHIVAASNQALYTYCLETSVLHVPAGSALTSCSAPVWAVYHAVTGAGVTIPRATTAHFESKVQLPNWALAAFVSSACELLHDLEPTLELRLHVQHPGHGQPRQLWQQPSNTARSRLGAKYSLDAKELLASVASQITSELRHEAPEFELCGILTQPPEPAPAGMPLSPPLQQASSQIVVMMRISAQSLQGLVFLWPEESVDRIWEGLQASCAWATLRRDALSAVMLSKMRRPAPQLPLPLPAEGTTPQPLVLAAMHETHVLARLIASVTVPRSSCKEHSPRDSGDGTLTVHRSPGNKSAIWSHRQNRGSTGSMTEVMIADDKRLAVLSALPPLSRLPSSFALDEGNNSSLSQKMVPSQETAESEALPADPLARYGAEYLVTCCEEQSFHETKRNFSKLCLSWLRGDAVDDYDTETLGQHVQLIKAAARQCATSEAMLPLLPKGSQEQHLGALGSFCEWICKYSTFKPVVTVDQGGHASSPSQLKSAAHCDGSHLYLSSAHNNSILVVVDMEVLSNGCVRATAHSCNTHDQARRRRGHSSEPHLVQVAQLIAALNARSFVFDFAVQVIVDQVRRPKPTVALKATLEALEQQVGATENATSNWHRCVKVTAPRREGFRKYFRSFGQYFGAMPVDAKPEWFLFDRNNSVGLLLLSGTEATLHVLTIDMEHPQLEQIVDTTVAQVQQALEVAALQCELDHKWLQFAMMPTTQAGTDKDRAVVRACEDEAADLFLQLRPRLERTPLSQLDPTLEALSSCSLNWRSMCTELAKGPRLRWLLFEIPEQTEPSSDEEQSGFHVVLMRKAEVEPTADLALCDKLAWGREQLMLHVHVPIDDTVDPTVEVCRRQALSSESMVCARIQLKMTLNCA